MSEYATKCATDGCMHGDLDYFESGGVGSWYCRTCLCKVLRMAWADTHQRLECCEVERDAARLRALRAEKRVREIAELPCVRHPVHKGDPDPCSPADRCTYCRCRAFVGQLDHATKVQAMPGGPTLHELPADVVADSKSGA